jgi:hypothetical protein
MKIKFADSSSIQLQEEEFEVPIIVGLVIQLLLLPLNGMQFLVILKNSKDCPVRVNLHGKKRFFWNKHSPCHWESQSTAEVIFSTDSARLKSMFTIEEMLLGRSESLSPQYEWAE